MKCKLQSLMASLSSIKMTLVTTTDETQKLGFENLLQETEGEIAELERNLREAGPKANTLSPQTLNRQAVSMIAALKEVEKFDVSSVTCSVEDWCEKIEQLEKLHTKGENSGMVHEFYKQVCGRLDTVTYSQWEADDANDGTIQGLVTYLRLEYGDKTSIYQMLHSIWTMEKSETKNFKQTAAEMQHEFTKVMKTVKATYKKSMKKDLDVDSFADIVCGMIFCDLARKADPQTFKLATRDMDDKFTASDIAASLKMLIDRNGETDSVTKAETSDAFYGTNPKYANKGKNGRNGNKKGKNQDGGNRNSSRDGKSGRQGENKNSSNGGNNGGIPADICRYQFTQKGCYKKNCNKKHGLVAGQGGNNGDAGNRAHGSIVNTAMHATSGTASPRPQQSTMASPYHASSMPPSPYMMQPPMVPQMNTHFVNHNNGDSDPDFQVC